MSDIIIAPALPEDIDAMLVYTVINDLGKNKEFVAINKKQTLAQVFAEIRYTKRDNEAMSATLLETLKRQGFLD